MWTIQQYSSTSLPRMMCTLIRPQRSKYLSHRVRMTMRQLTLILIRWDRFCNQSRRPVSKSPLYKGRRWCLKILYFLFL